MADASLGSPLRAFVRLTVYFGFTLSMMPVQGAALVLKLPARLAIPRWYHGWCCRILGIQIERRGRQSRETPTLYASNHVSYLDITVLGALISGSFVAKSEVKAWPYFGWLARMQRTIFVERRTTRAMAPRDPMLRRLEVGESLVLFPEGTSGDGNFVLPFKSALMSVVEQWTGEGPLVVQPVSIAYTKLDGLPMGRYLRPFFAWYGNMDLLPHLWQLAGLGRPTVVVHFHPPVTLADMGSRKALSQHCQIQAGRGLSAALAGRPLRSQAPPDTKAA